MIVHDKAQRAKVGPQDKTWETRRVAVTKCECTVYDAPRSTLSTSTLAAGTLVVVGTRVESAGWLQLYEPTSGWINTSTSVSTRLLQMISGPKSTQLEDVASKRVKYAIIGAGQSGLQFLTACVTKAAGSAAIVDKRTSIGGHWTDQYSFVRLHAPKATYGLDTSKWEGA